MSNCGTCKHYKPDDDPGEWGGKCLRIKHGNGGQKNNFTRAHRDRYDTEQGWGIYSKEELDAELLRLADTEKAAVTDGSGYHASLRVQPDFGCVLHEVKP